MRGKEKDEENSYHVFVNGDLYLHDLRQTPANHIAYYGSEVRIRVILDLLIKKNRSSANYLIL